MGGPDNNRTMSASKPRLALVAVLLTLTSQFSLAAEDEEFDAQAAYQASCFACHGTGQAHAPMVGEAIEWEIRLEKGMDTLMTNTINGLNGVMPARGLCVDCSDEQLRAIVEYMIEQSI